MENIIFGYLLTIIVDWNCGLELFTKIVVITFKSFTAGRKGVYFKRRVVCVNLCIVDAVVDSLSWFDRSQDITSLWVYRQYTSKPRPDPECRLEVTLQLLHVFPPKKSAFPTTRNARHSCATGSLSKCKLRRQTFGLLCLLDNLFWRDLFVKQTSFEAAP